jgi:hypothetical protein
VIVVVETETAVDTEADVTVDTETDVTAEIMVAPEQLVVVPADVRRQEQTELSSGELEAYRVS